MDKLLSNIFTSDKIKCVIFDMDGTFYDINKLRRIMFWRLCLYYILRPHRMNELKILFYFRREREHRAGEQEIARNQYEQVAKTLNVKEEKVRKTVEKWILYEPVKNIPQLKYSGVIALTDELRRINKKVAILSDYPPYRKIKALNLKPDIVVCSTDVEVDALKPNEKGFLYIASCLGVQAEECLVIGDTEGKDGKGAMRAGMQFLKVTPQFLKEAQAFYLNTS